MRYVVFYHGRAVDSFAEEREAEDAAMLEVLKEYRGVYSPRMCDEELYEVYKDETAIRKIEGLELCSVCDGDYVVEGECLTCGAK